MHNSWMVGDQTVDRAWRLLDHPGGVDSGVLSWRLSGDVGYPGADGERAWVEGRLGGVGHGIHLFFGL